MPHNLPALDLTQVFISLLVQKCASNCIVCLITGAARCSWKGTLFTAQMSLNKTGYQIYNLKIIIFPDFLPRASRCEMYKVSQENLPGFLGGNFPGNETWETVTCRNTTGWHYDQRWVQFMPRDSNRRHFLRHQVLSLHCNLSSF